MGKKITVTQGQFQDDLGEEMLKFTLRAADIADGAGEEICATVNGILYGKKGTVICTIQGEPIHFVNMIGSLIVNYEKHSGIPASVLLGALRDVVKYKSKRSEKIRSEEINY